MNDFSLWLYEEIKSRGWSQNETARRAGVSSGQISNVLNGQSKPGDKVLTGIARAFCLPASDVMRRAGMLPTLPDPDDQTLEEIADHVKHMEKSDRRQILTYARFLSQPKPRLMIREPSAGYSTDAAILVDIIEAWTPDQVAMLLSIARAMAEHF